MFSKWFLLVALTACFVPSAVSASSDIAGIPDDAVIVETQALPVPGRSLVLWMLHPVRHEDTIDDGLYMCPDQTAGHYFEGPTRVSLINTTLRKVINTAPVRFDWGTDDSFFVPYRIADFFYSIHPLPGEKEAKPQILLLKDFTGEGEATQFALFDAQNCSIVATTIYGYSRKRDELLQYPFNVTLHQDAIIEKSTRYWMDHFALQKPVSAGYWKYSIEYNMGSRSTYEIRFDKERETFVAAVVSVPIRR